MAAQGIVARATIAGAEPEGAGGRRLLRRAPRGGGVPLGGRDRGAARDERRDRRPRRQGARLRGHAGAAAGADRRAARAGDAGGAARAQARGRGGGPARPRARARDRAARERARAIDRADFDRAVDLLAGARPRARYGLGPNGPLADYFTLRLRRFGRRAQAITSSGLRLADALLAVEPGDALLLIAYERLDADPTAVLQRANDLEACRSCC